MSLIKIQTLFIVGIFLLIGSANASPPPPLDSTLAKKWIGRDLDRRLSLGILTGVWMPKGGTELIGDKFQVGMYMGGRVHGWGADILIGFRLGKASNPYQVVHDGAKVSTDHFLGGEILLMACRRILKAGSHETELQLGLGIDAFDAIEDEENPKTIISFGNSIGIAHYYLIAGGSAQIGLQLQYSFVDYDTNGGTDLSGNTLSLNLLLGVGGPPIHSIIEDNIEE